MVHPTPRPEQTTLRLSWIATLDLTQPAALAEVTSLRRLAPGTRVVVHVGAKSPWDVDLDRRLPALLVERGRALDLDLELQGTLEAITDWWHALRDIEDPRRAGRHLRAVPAGASW